MQPKLALGFLLLLLAVAAAQPSTTACTQSKTFPVPASLTNDGILKLVIPAGTATVQAVQGSAWGIVGYSSSPLDTYTLSFGTPANNVHIATFANSGTTSPATSPGATTVPGSTTVPGGTTPSSTTPKPASSSSSLLRMQISGAVLISAVVACWASFGRRGTSAIIAGILVGAVLVSSITPVYYWCQSVTLVVTYPPGAQIFVNGFRVPTCHTASPAGTAAVQTPVLYKNRDYLNTFWFSSPIVFDIDQDPTCTTNCNEVIVCSSTCSILNGTSFAPIPQCSGVGCTDPMTLPGRAYSPPILADLEGNGRIDLCATGKLTVKCWEYDPATKMFAVKSGWPKVLDTLNPPVTSGEIRGLAAADVDHDGKIEIFVSTTDSALQIYAFKPDGTTLSGWPRYNTAGGTLEDGNAFSGGPAARNGMGHVRYGSYGLNLGIGNMDDDLFPEIVNTFDDHQIQAFKKNGVALNCAGAYTNPRNYQGSLNQPLTWGQAYNRQTNKTTDDTFLTTRGGCFPSPYPTSGDPCQPSANPCVPQGDAWMQFTQSPPSIMDVNGDGKAEVLVLPNSELGGAASCSPPYITQQRVLFVAGGAYGNGGDPTSTASTTSCRRVTGFDTQWPPGGVSIACKGCQTNPSPCAPTNSGNCRTGIYYPPEAVPSIAFADLVGDGNSEAVFSFNDGKMVCYDGTGTQKWSFDFAAMAGFDIQTKAFEPSEPVLADLNGDGKPEVVFSCYGYPDSALNNQRLVILNGQTGALLFNLDVKAIGTYSLNGNGNGAAGAPTVADIDGDGDLEIIVHTFDGRVVAWSVPGSSSNCLVWPTGRGGYLRKGQPDIPLTY